MFLKNENDKANVRFDWSLIAMPVLTNPPMSAGKIVEIVVFEFANLEKYTEIVKDHHKDLFFKEYELFKKTQPDPIKRVDLAFSHAIPSVKMFLQTNCSTLEDVAKLDVDKIKRSIELESEEKVLFIENLRVVINIVKTAIDDFKTTPSDETKKVVRSDKIEVNAVK